MLLGTILIAAFFMSICTKNVLNTVFSNALSLQKIRSNFIS